MADPTSQVAISDSDAVEPGECPEWQRELTVNQPPHGFEGSSPSSPTSLRSLRELRLGKPAPLSRGERAKAAAPKPIGRRRALPASYGSASHPASHFPHLSRASSPPSSETPPPADRAQPDGSRTPLTDWRGAGRVRLGSRLPRWGNPRHRSPIAAPWSRRTDRRARRRPPDLARCGPCSSHPGAPLVRDVRLVRAARELCADRPSLRRPLAASRT